MKKTCLAAFVLLGATAYGLNWDNALIMGTTPGGKMFYEPGEEMVFTLKLEGMKDPLPANTYFVDWERRGDDGLKERGRAPLPFPPEGLVLKTKSDKPGFVCIEANVVTKDGKRVPKNHRWEKRVFFQGGAGVQPERIPMADEPKDYDAFWAKCLEELATVPMDAQMTPVECPDKEVRLYAVRIPCAGPWPVTGYLTIPVKASKTNRMPITASYRGASQDEQLAPKGKADLAFLLHGFYHLKPGGVMGIVQPHGVLFRGAAEGTIRRHLVEDGSIYAVIGLPANIFFNTSIPTCVIVLRKDNTSRDILFIDASQEFEKGKNQNKLTDANIDKIVSTFFDRKDVEKYAHLASFEEIKKNDFNLNIARYVDTSEEEEEIDPNDVYRELQKVDSEISETNAKLNKFFEELGIEVRL